jgi:hypothetical protein
VGVVGSGERWSRLNHVFQLCLSLPQRPVPCPPPFPSLLPSPTQSPQLSPSLCWSGWHFHRTHPSFPYFFILFIFLLQVHPHLTLRSRTHSKPQSDSLHRHTSLTCLVCRLSVYRVLQFIPLDMDATEGLVSPTEEWVEHQVLQSGSGWIELAKKCLVSLSAGHKNVSLAFSLAVFCSHVGLFKDR